METVRVPKGTIVRLNGFPCELVEDAYVFNTTIAGVELKTFLQSTEEGRRAVAEDEPALTSKAKS
jgi:hypothetical protein